MENSNRLLTIGERELHKEWVAKCDYHFVGIKTTVCVLTLNNGFELVGTSSRANPLTFDGEMGKHYALKNALHRLEELAGFALHEQA